MITAVDSSALIAVFLGESDSDAWMDLLVQSRREGALVISDIVAAELFAVVQDKGVFHQILDDLGLSIVPVSVDASCEAGRIFGEYRKQGGPRKYLIPDFLIGAHALVDCDRLIAADRGYLRRYFTGLDVLTVH
jgi:predicted nucleic acid-binding protein